MTYDFHNLPYFKKNSLSRFLPKIFPGYPQAWNACYRNIKRHFLFLSSQECCSQQLNTWKTACGAARDRCGMFQAVFPSRLHTGLREHMLYFNHYSTRQPFPSHIDFFFWTVFQVNLLSVLENKCLQWCHWSVLLEYTPTSSTSQSESSLWAYLCSGGQRGTLDVQGEEIGSGEEWRGEKEGEMKGWFRNSVHLYLRGWEPAPAGCLRERWCPRCWSYHPPRPACAPAGHTHPTNTVRGRFIVIRCMFTNFF